MSPYDRLVSRLAAQRLDQTLAAGASPSSSAALTLRAQTLTAPGKRRDLAAALRRIARREVRPAAFGVWLAAERPQVTGARPELERLARRLADSDPVAPQGVALTQVLLTDGAGPLLWERSREDLCARLRQALVALEPEAAAEPQTGASR